MAARLSGRGLGIDLGTKRIGVAVCDSDGTVASPYETIERSGDRRQDHRRLTDLVDETEAMFVVVGVPYTLGGGDTGPAAAAILQEIDELRVALPERCQLHLQDERLTTVTADRRLTEMNVKGRRRRQLVDQVAAAIILQAWLDRR